MIPYRVYQQDRHGVLNYSASSQALGRGIQELDLIVDGHGLKPGDVVQIEADWLIVQAPGEYVYLPPYADEAFHFGDGCWCAEMRSRLQREATVCEKLTEERRKK